MESVLDVAFYLYDEYHKKMHRSLDEMKLHKLLYFSQRESLVRSDRPLFEEDFQGWKFGPVCVPVRIVFRQKGFENAENYIDIRQKLSRESQDIIDTAIDLYGKKESWSLSDITHSEYSWQQSRAGVGDGENGDKIILLDDIRVDARRIRERRDKLKGVQVDNIPVNTASYIPIINEEDMFSDEEESVNVAEKIEEICEELVRRRNSHGRQRKK